MLLSLSVFFIPIQVLDLLPLHLSAAASAAAAAGFCFYRSILQLSIPL